MIIKRIREYINRGCIEEKFFKLIKNSQGVFCDTKR